MEKDDQSDDSSDFDDENVQILIEVPMSWYNMDKDTPSKIPGVGNSSGTKVSINIADKIK